MTNKQKIFKVVVLLLIVLLNACHEVGNNQTDKKTDSTSSNLTLKNEQIDKSGLPSFIGKNAWDICNDFCKIGPRNPNSTGSKKGLKFILDFLKPLSTNVKEQNFIHDGYNGEKVNLTNVIATFNPDASKRILLCTHWDSRPRAEEDSDSTLHNLPILGANDGGSGTAVLLELAKILKENPPKFGVDLVSFDGEDYGKEGDLESYFLGARYFSKNLPIGYKPSFGILLDIVGDHNAIFEKEGFSMEKAPDVVNVIWNGANDLGLTQFKNILGGGISDDHYPLNDVANIPTIDIIDIEMVGNRSNDPNRRYWHTHQDTMDKISESSLGNVGKLMVYTIYKLTKY
ncbi:MAG: M28 family peptidase [Chlorobi bacterium]|nr:M28 family peptidase [Chlorobiota bacterium]